MRLGIKFIFLFFFSGSFIWGQVKIGDNVEVLNPAAVLELEATDKGLLLPRLTNEQRDSIELNEASEGLLIFNVDTNEIQYLKRHSSPVKNGNIGIGDSTPTEASLVVSGSIVASGDITANAVLTPDYVLEHYFIGESFFQPHYQFMSLVEVKEFIQKHHHLPNVFSRKEIEKQGGIKLNVALEQQLEKIEELFLYAIEQEKRINYLEAKLQEIEPCIAEQKKR